MNNKQILRTLDDYGGLECLWNFGDGGNHYFQPKDIEDPELLRLLTEATDAMHAVHDYLKSDLPSLTCPKCGSRMYPEMGVAMQCSRCHYILASG